MPFSSAALIRSSTPGAGAADDAVEGLPDAALAAAAAAAVAAPATLDEEAPAGRRYMRGVSVDHQATGAGRKGRQPAEAWERTCRREQWALDLHLHRRATSLRTDVGAVQDTG